MKDFNIGFIEGVINEAITTREPKDVFARIARAIGSKKLKSGGPQKISKKDWNAQVQRKASKTDLIGSSSETERRRMSRQSLRRYIIDNENAAMSDVDSTRLVEYNPKLADVTPATRVAYVKFKTRKIKKEYKYHQKVAEGENEDEDVFEPDTNHKPQPSVPRLASILKVRISLTAGE
jgi:hypothetical protein